MIFDWTSGSAVSQWDIDEIRGDWTVGFSTLTISHLSTEYILIPISVTKAGDPFNPTSDEVQFAFMPNPVQQPGMSDWVTGEWDTDTSNIIYPYNAKCLVGPTGTITLGTGAYSIYVKVFDDPETPVLVAGQLIVS